MRAAAAVILGLAALPTPSAAHGPPVALESWGPFGRANARCQRYIASSAAVCAVRVWETRRACLAQDLDGSGCDQTAVNAAIDSFRIEVFDTVQAACSNQEVMNLKFVDVFEAANDAVTFCRQLDTAAASAVTLPVPDDPLDAGDEARACIGAAADATSHLLHRAFRSRQRVFNRFAQRPFSKKRKEAMVATSSAGIGHDMAQIEASIGEVCPADAFLRTYGRDAAAFLAGIASRGDCLAGLTYTQGAVVCPAAQCGNGMREAGERCDDGNAVGGDGCGATCQLE